MMLTPTVAETATANATMATPVRERPAAMPSTARRADVPPSLLATGAVHAEAKRTKSGTQSAKPRISMNTAASPATRFVPETKMSNTAASIVPMPTIVTAGSAWRARCSSVERANASCG